MEKKKKIEIKELQVNSFVTTLNASSKETVDGGKISRIAFPTWPIVWCLSDITLNQEGCRRSVGETLVLTNPCCA